MRLRDRIAYAPLDDAGGGGDGNEGSGAGGGSAAPSGDAAPAWAKTLTDTSAALNTTMTQLLDMAKANQQQQRSAPAPTPEPDEDDDADDLPTAADLETMSRAELVAFINKSVMATINQQVVKPINDQLQQITAVTTRSEIQGSVKELAAENKDFWDWKDEMIVLANEHRGLPPKRLLQIARAENPEKYKTLQAKYNPSAEPGTKRIRLSGFGGLTPSQSGTGSRSRKMSPKEASNVAWAETVAALGGEPVFGDEDDD